MLFSCVEPIRAAVSFTAERRFETKAVIREWPLLAAKPTFAAVCGPSGRFPVTRAREIAIQYDDGFGHVGVWIGFEQQLPSPVVLSAGCRIKKLPSEAIVRTEQQSWFPAAAYCNAASGAVIRTLICVCKRSEAVRNGHQPINGCIAFLASLNYDVPRGNAVSP
jgi:hypothetical protein